MKKDLRGKNNPMFGVKMSLTSRKKMRIAKSGKNHPFFGKHLSESHKKNIGKANKGHRHTEECKYRMRIAHLGMKMSISHKLKLKLANSGSKSHFWKGGRRKSRYSRKWTEQLKESIRERDGHICQICGKYILSKGGYRNRNLEVHHIDYNKKNCNPENLISLCVGCHAETNTDREFWQLFFIRGLQKKVTNISQPVCIERTKAFFEECLALQKTKGKDYTETQDAFQEIKEEARVLGIAPHQVLWLALQKHYKALKKYCIKGKVESESIQSRLRDLVNYISLMAVLINLKKNK